MSAASTAVSEEREGATNHRHLEGIEELSERIALGCCGSVFVDEGYAAMSSSSYLASLADPPDPSGYLVCFHHAGGGARAFHDWPDKLQSSLSIDAVELPGRGKRFGEPMPSEISEVRDAIVEVVTDAWPDDLPVVFFGHSLGAVLAGEVALEVEDRGLTLSRLVVSGTRPPHRREDRGLHELPDEELRDELRQMGGTPPDVLEDEELMELYLPVIRGDLQLIASYAPRAEPLEDCGITVIAGEKDHQVDRLEEADWERYTQRDVVVQWFPGGHFYLQEHADRVLEWMENHLITSGVLPA